MDHATHMDGSTGLDRHEIAAGDRVSLMDDDWDSIADAIVVVDAEPVPGSTQCLIRAGTETWTVSRARLSRAT